MIHVVANFTIRRDFQKEDQGIMFVFMPLQDKKKTLAMEVVPRHVSLIINARSYYSICSHNYSFYPIAHTTMLRTTVMETSYLHRIASKAPKLSRSSRGGDVGVIICII
jgi:hypothetical protein